MERVRGLLNCSAMNPKFSKNRKNKSFDKFHAKQKGNCLHDKCHENRQKISSKETIENHEREKRRAVY